MAQYRGEKVRYRRRGLLRLRCGSYGGERISAYGLAKFTGSASNIYRLDPAERNGSA